MLFSVGFRVRAVCHIVRCVVTRPPLIGITIMQRTTIPTMVGAPPCKVIMISAFTDSLTDPDANASGLLQGSFNPSLEGVNT